MKHSITISFWSDAGHARVAWGRTRAGGWVVGIAGLLLTAIVAFPAPRAWAEGARPDETAAADKAGGEFYSAEELYRIYQMYIDAYRAQEVRDATRQLEILRELARRRPKSGYVRTRIAMALLGEERIEEALEEAQEAVKLSPDEVEPYQALGQALFHSNKIDAAGDAFERALEIEPGDYVSLLYLGEIYEIAGEFLNAATVNMRLAYLRPNQAWQHQYKAAVDLIRAGELERAVEMLERVIEVNPGHHEAYVRLGTLYQKLERWADAIRIYKEIIQRFRFRDAVADAHVRLSEIYYHLGRSEEAEEELRWVVENRPTLLAARRDLGMLRFYSGDYEGAIDLLTEWVEENPEREGDAFHLARAYQKRAEDARSKGEVAGAAENASQAAYWYGRILDQVPDHTRALEELRSVLPPERIGEALARYDAAVAAITASATEGELGTEALLRLAYLSTAKAEAAEDAEAADVVRLATGAREAAKQFYGRVLEQDPANTDALRALAGMHQEREEWTEARKYYARLLEVDPGDIVILYRAGFCELQLRDYAAASEHFRHGLDVIDARLGEATEAASASEPSPKERLEERLNPLRTVLYYYLGVAEFLRRDYAAAEAALRRGLELSPESIDYVHQLAVTLQRRQKPEEARALLEGALEKHPDDPELIARLAQLYEEEKQYDAAVELLEGALVEHPEDDALRVRLAMAYEGKGDAGRAESVLEEAIAADPENEELYLQLAFVFEKQQAIDRVEKVIERLLKVRPNSAAAFNFLGYTYADHNVRINEAYELVRKALAIEPNNGMYVDSLGWVYYRQGKYLDAARELRRAVELLGDDPVILEHLGDALQSLGQTDEALVEWRKAAEIDPKNEELKAKIDRAKQVRQD